VESAAWAELCELFAWRMLVLTEQLRPELDDLEGSEEDPDRLARLYRIDHGVTRMRRVARELRVLSGHGEQEIAGYTTSLLDVIRMAASAIEHYGRLSVGTVAELAIVPYAADDVASVIAALADNATQYSPSEVTISAHLLADGGVMFRVEDDGLGIDPVSVDALNSVLDGPVPAPGPLAGPRAGFPVVHRLARTQGLRVQLACRQLAGPGSHRGNGTPVGAAGLSGTIAMVVVPAPLLCEIPGEPMATDARTGQRLVGAGARTAGAPARAGRVRARSPHSSPAHAAPAARTPSGPGTAVADIPVPPDFGDEGADATLPRRVPGSVRAPAAQASPAPARRDMSSQAADGFAFAADLEAFSAAVGDSRPGGTGREDQPAAAEGQQP
jgi:hypothetical protein